MPVSKLTVRKFDGDDMYSWAVFRKADIPKGLKGPLFSGDAPPLITGLTRTGARYYLKRLERREMPGGDN